MSNSTLHQRHPHSSLQNPPPVIHLSRSSSSDSISSNNDSLSNFTPPNFTIKELLGAIPPHCFQRSAIRSMSYVLWDAFLSACLIYTASHIDIYFGRSGLWINGIPGRLIGLASWALYGYAIGLVWTGKLIDFCLAFHLFLKQSTHLGCCPLLHRNQVSGSLLMNVVINPFPPPSKSTIPSDGSYTQPSSFLTIPGESPMLSITLPPVTWHGIRSLCPRLAPNVVCHLSQLLLPSVSVMELPIAACSYTRFFPPKIWTTDLMSW